MISLTQKERETLLILFKEFNEFYNANSISKKIGISHVGAQKIFKRLQKECLVTSKKIGKSIVYKLKLDEPYVIQLMNFILSDEANNFKRWKEEFKGLLNGEKIILLFGSCIRNYKNANDIDLLIVLEKKDLKQINDYIKEKEKILPKKLHVIKLSYSELMKNIKNENKAIINIIKNNVVLYGQEKFVEVIKNVTHI